MKWNGGIAVKLFSTGTDENSLENLRGKQKNATKTLRRKTQ